MPSTEIYDIIKNTAFTDRKKTTLRSYFYKNTDEMYKAVNVLDTCKLLKEKLDFIKETFLKP
ncbi:9845_t:CDS:1, partial [Funneliformis geosporum]